MESKSVFVPASNSSIDLESYITLSSIKKIESISDKIVLGVYSIVLIFSLIQTFWKNKRIDRLLSFINEAYSNGKFGSSQINYQEQIITCYRFDHRFSYIPNPNKLILLIIATHIQILIVIIIRTLFVRRSEIINDCFVFEYPYEILQCENNLDPCKLNSTENFPKCSYYYFEMSNIITMVTSVITWHYALRYLVVKLVRFIRWFMFRNDDQPRMFCCCCRLTPRILRCIMYFDYILLWIYLFFIILCGFLWNMILFRIPVNMLGSVWSPIIIAGDRLCSLTLALVPELLQNWLDATENGQILKVLDSKGLILTNVEPLIYLTRKKSEFSTKSKNNSQVIVESISHT